ncbi:MAG: hypothetical protein BWK72_16705 [Rhodoferax ferrireducens]|uniref:Transmembrane protein n=1 Tax=Rhodoferax ferrireducens TaxID=192843 RepID=A0A1W9KR87_9BURK|nr:MAG: hypothetical protein BWK72_16705 [Rhodoferax ferrireducens]
MREWLSFLIEWTLVAVATIAVFEGFRCFSLRQPLSKYAALLIFGVGVLGGYAAALSWSVSALDSVLTIADGGPPRQLPEAALAQMTPQEKEEKTRILAQITFTQTGKLAMYSDASGRQILYAPSEEEIRAREVLRESLGQARARLEFIRTEVWMFALFAIVAALAGIFIRNRRRSG